MGLKLLVSPLAKAAYFADYLDVCRAEILALFPGTDVAIERRGSLDLVNTDLEPAHADALARASFVQAVLEEEPAGSDTGLRVVDTDTRFLLHEDFVYGAKYQGKTNELVTQLGLNVGLAAADVEPDAGTLLDPMAGRGTTLLWAIRYGMNARGIEQDADALDALHRHVRKQTKLHRVKHRHTEGYIGKRGKSGRFVRYEMSGRALQLIAGDSRDAVSLLGGQRFNLLLTDLPYGIQHRGAGRRRDPLDTIRACAPEWVESVRPGGAIVLIYNTYQPKPDALADVFTTLGCVRFAFSAPHRMSESIVRDLAVFTRP